MLQIPENSIPKANVPVRAYPRIVKVTWPVRVAPEPKIYKEKYHSTQGEDIFNFTDMETGWDGDYALVAELESAELADKIYAELENNFTLNRLAVSPSIFGGIDIEWQSAENRVKEISIYNDSAIELKEYKANTQAANQYSYYQYRSRLSSLWIEDCKTRLPLEKIFHFISQSARMEEK
jgi:hypothetical protein